MSKNILEFPTTKKMTIEEMYEEMKKNSKEQGTNDMIVASSISVMKDENGEVYFQMSSPYNTYDLVGILETVKISLLNMELMDMEED